MRSRKEILKDFKICHLDELDCTKCSYYCDGICMDADKKMLEKEIIALLEKENDWLIEQISELFIFKKI